MENYSIESAMTPVSSPEKEMSGHAEMMCQVLMQLGKLEAKIDGLISSEKKDEAEDKKEAGEYQGTDGMLSLPSHSTAGAMLDSSYNSSTSTYDGLPRTGTYNGSML